MLPVIRGQCDVCGVCRNLGAFESGLGSSSVPCDCRATHGCNGSMAVVHRGSKSSIPKEFDGSRPCLCKRRHVDLEVTAINGDSWSLEARAVWSIAHTKEELAALTGIAAQEQRLLCGMLQLANSATLNSLLPAEGADSMQEETLQLQLSVVRRDPVQGEWLRRVVEDGKVCEVLQEAPGSTLGDHEIMLAAVEHDLNALYLAAPELLEDPDFAFAVGKLRNGPSQPLAEPRTDWIQAPVDVLLAIYLAGHLAAPGMVTAAQQSPARSKACDEELASLVPALAFASERLADAGSADAPLTAALEDVLQGLPKEALLPLLLRCVLKSLLVALRFLDIVLMARERGMGGHMRRWFGGRPSVARTGNDALMPSDFAMELFLAHAQLFIDGQEGRCFERLLEHLRRARVPDLEACSALVRACAAQGKADDASSFFRSAGDGSQRSFELMTSTQLPLVVLHHHRHRSALLTKVLHSWGDSREILAAIAEDRGRICGLLRHASEDGDAEIGRLPELEEALRAAVEAGQERPGRILLRAIVAPEPQRIPDGCEVPLTWLDELREVRGGDSVAIDLLLQHLEARGSERENEDAFLTLARDCWHLVAWPRANLQQTRRAGQQLRRWGRLGTLQLADVHGREAEERHLALEEQLGGALAVLPLERFEEAPQGPEERKALLLAPELPAQATAMLALEAAKKAESTVDRLRGEVDAARRETQQVRDEARRRNDELEHQISRLRSEVDSLRSSVRRATSQN